jgi:mRNA-degrading endonuclease RelE of RelBE toxin-antitoxin system
VSALRNFFTSGRFNRDFDGLSKGDRERVEKAIGKIRAAPELGKPLRAPLSGFYSERVGSLRIIYSFNGASVFLYQCRKRKDGY